MIRTSKNLNSRIRILKQTVNRLIVDRDNGNKVDRELLQDCQQQLAICKQLCRQEMLKAPLEELLQWVET